MFKAKGNREMSSDAPSTADERYTGGPHRHCLIVDEWAPRRRLDPCRSRTGQRPAAAYIVRAVRSGAIHCVIGISSSARDQPGRGAPLPQLPGQVMGVLDFAVLMLPSPPPVGGLMTRAESPASKTPGRPAGTVLSRATWAPML
jgi:hypothetical protein